MTFLHDSLEYLILISELLHSTVKYFSITAVVKSRNPLLCAHGLFLCCLCSWANRIISTQNNSKNYLFINYVKIVC